MESVDVLIHKVRTNAFDRLQIITVQEILNGTLMNLPLMGEVTKRAQKAKTNQQTNLFDN